MLSARSAGPTTGPSLLCRAGSSVCAISVECIDEIMRPLPIDRVTRGPSFVLGLAVIRGEPTPVVALSALLSERSEAAAPVPSNRFVSLRVGSRRVALAVDAVIGVRELAHATLAELPPLFRETSSALIAQVGTLDAELLLVLRGAQLVPDDVWNAFEASAS